MPWHLEVQHQLPVAVWRAVMAEHFPNATWLRLHADTLEALQRYRTDRGIISLDDAVDELLKTARAQP